MIIFVYMLTAEIIAKYKGKNLSWLIDKAQDNVNRYVRKRDSLNGFFICISCQELKPVNQLNSGHYFAKEVKQYRAVRFDLDNLQSQCIRCNKYLSGNLIPYRKNLIEKIGLERFEKLERLAELPNFQYDRNILISIIERFKNI